MTTKAPRAPPIKGSPYTRTRPGPDCKLVHELKVPGCMSRPCYCAEPRRMLRKLPTPKIHLAAAAAGAANDGAPVQGVPGLAVRGRERAGPAAKGVRLLLLRLQPRVPPGRQLHQ